MTSSSTEPSVSAPSQAFVLDNAPPELRNAIKAQLQEVKRGSDTLLVESEFIDKLARSLQTKKPLRIKLGLDPTAPDIHLGHTVVLNKLRQLQRLGHTVIFLIGDFTAMIGDPSGRNQTRPPLSAEQIREHAATYQAQAMKILDPAATEIRYNSEWSTPLGAAGLIRLASRYTVARILERDDFTQRLRTGVPIALHELIYPLMQGNDSVALAADLEIGGTDQRFNLLVGRELQKTEGLAPQCILTMPLLEGLDGVEKMSKSKNNYVGIMEPPDEIFGKLMSISDELMWRYYELLSFCDLAQISALRASVDAGANPRDVKVRLAQEIVARFHSDSAATAALASFEARFRAGAVPESMPEYELSSPPDGILLTQVLRQTEMAASASEARRAIEQGGVRIGGERVIDPQTRLPLGTHVLQIGKRRWARVSLSIPSQEQTS